MAKIISVINFKGGVGKTTVSVNVAACMAHKYKKKVLLVDLDPQSNASIWLLGETRWQYLATKKKNNTIQGIMFGAVQVDDTIRKPYWDAAKGKGIIASLDLIPAVYSMFNLEEQIIRAMITAKGNDKYASHDEHKYLARNMKGFLKDSDYDVTIFDCPPNLYAVAKNALFISDYYLVPCVPDALSSIGLKELLDAVERFAGTAKPFGGTIPSCLGVVLNMPQGKFGDPVKDMRGTVDQLRGKGLTIKDLAEVLDTAPIRIYKAHQEAIRQFQPICLYSEKKFRDPSAENAYSDIIQVTKKIMDKAAIPRNDQ